MIIHSYRRSSGLASSHSVRRMLRQRLAALALTRYTLAASRVEQQRENASCSSSETLSCGTRDLDLCVSIARATACKNIGL